MEISLNESLKPLYPDLKVGLLFVSNVVNKDFDPALESKKKEAELFIRANFLDFANLPRVNSYNKFYNNYDKRFPIEYQLKSIISGKSIPAVSVLVESMFISELLNQVLVAGHDLDYFDGDLIVDLAKGDEEYVKINNEKQPIKKDDIIMSDLKGVVASVLYGPDFRTRITRHTTNVVYIGYFVHDFSNDDILKSMQDIADNVLVSNPDAKVEPVRIVKFDNPIRV